MYGLHHSLPWSTRKNVHRARRPNQTFREPLTPPSPPQRSRQTDEPDQNKRGGGFGGPVAFRGARVFAIWWGVSGGPTPLVMGAGGRGFVVSLRRIPKEPGRRATKLPSKSFEADTLLRSLSPTTGAGGPSKPPSYLRLFPFGVFVPFVFSLQSAGGGSGPQLPLVSFSRIRRHLSCGGCRGARIFCFPSVCLVLSCGPPR